MKEIRKNTAFFTPCMNNKVKIGVSACLLGHSVRFDGGHKKNPVLPFARQRFDRVICTASIEYLTQPITIFSEIRQLLKPEGKFIVTFSNRWFATKAVMLWAEMHEFERLGLVTDYFREANWSGPVNTISNRGLLRADDDPHYEKTPFSDPVYAVWGRN